MRAKIAAQMVIWSNLCFRGSEQMTSGAPSNEDLASCLTLSNLLIEGREYS